MWSEIRLSFLLNVTVPFFSRLAHSPRLAYVHPHMCFYLHTITKSPFSRLLYLTDPRLHYEKSYETSLFSKLYMGLPWLSPLDTKVLLLKVFLAIPFCLLLPVSFTECFQTQLSHATSSGSLPECSTPSRRELSFLPALWWRVYSFITIVKEWLLRTLSRTSALDYEFLTTWFLVSLYSQCPGQSLLQARHSIHVS